MFLQSQYYYYSHYTFITAEIAFNNFCGTCSHKRKQQEWGDMGRGEGGRQCFLKITMKYVPVLMLRD